MTVTVVTTQPVTSAPCQAKPNGLLPDQARAAVTVMTGLRFRQWWWCGGGDLIASPQVGSAAWE